MPLQSGRQVRLTSIEKKQLHTRLAEQGYVMPTIRTTDDYFNATVAAATEEAKDIIAMALQGLLEQSASDPGE